MKLTILGSGSAIPTIARNSPGYFLEIGKDKILIDCGSGILRQLVRAKIDYYNLDYIFISHPHADHLTDLMGVLQSVRIWRQHYNKKKKRLTIVGYQGLKRDYKYLCKVMYRRYLKDRSVKILEMKNSTRRFSKWSVKSVLVKHTKLLCNAYRFNAKKSLVYSADCDYNENLVNLCRKADLAIMDCAMPIQKKIDIHMSPKECGEIAAKAKVKKIVLTHFYPTKGKYDFKKQAQKYYKGPIVVAKDLMKIEI